MEPAEASESIEPTDASERIEASDERITAAPTAAVASRRAGPC